LINIETMNIYDKYQKAVEIVPKTTIQIQEIFALLSGIRGAIRHTASLEDLEKIKLSFPEIFVHLNGEYFGKKTNACIIAKDEKTMETMIDNVFNDDHSHFDQELEGRLLGYPDCCIEHHTKYVDRRKIHKLDMSIYDCYKNSRKCSPYINNLLSISTRIRTKKDEINRKKYELLNKDSQLPIYGFMFISHMPCRHDCKESIVMGKTIDGLLKKYYPSLEKIIIDTLSKPILYFSVFNQIVFDGYIKGEVLYYKKIIPPYFPIFAELNKSINEGNRVWVNMKKISIMKDNKTICTYMKKNEADGFMVDFSG